MTGLSTSITKYHSHLADHDKSDEQADMERLLKRLPDLNETFQLHSKIGQGTFSTVYLATYKHDQSNRKYAVKHLTQTIEVSSIANELRCLQEIGGKDNVVPAELCLGNGEDCVTFIMPYLAHSRFSDYVVDMDAEETCLYMKNLFIALRRVHSFNIIHRDVKPNNFLYNRETKQFLLVDFGLAELVGTSNQTVRENTPIDYSKKRRRSSDEEKSCKRIALKSKDSNVKVEECKTERMEKVADETSLKSNRRKDLQDASTSKGGGGGSFIPLVPTKSQNGNFLQITNSKILRQRSMPVVYRLPTHCACRGKGAVCSFCSSKKPMFAPRAGTSGFRPPEVLFRYLHQTTAVDMWAAGVILLCILSGCYPFFNSSTDLAALAEIMTLFGTEQTINVAKKFGRRIVCSERRKPIDLKKLCRRLRLRSSRRSRREKSSLNEPKCRDCFQTIKKDGCICLSEENATEEEDDIPFRFPDSAFDLLYRLLDLDPTTRITAAEALDHPFITGQP